MSLELYSDILPFSLTGEPSGTEGSGEHDLKVHLECYANCGAV